MCMYRCVMMVYLLPQATVMLCKWNNASSRHDCEIKQPGYQWLGEQHDGSQTSKISLSVAVRALWQAARVLYLTVTNAMHALVYTRIETIAS